MKRRVAILVNMMPTYRQGFYDRLMGNEDLEITVFCQYGVPGSKMVSVHTRYGERVHLVPFQMLGRESVVWQWLPFRRILSDFDVVFVEGNPRYLSHFLVASYMRLLNRPVVLWNMIDSNRGDTITSRLRLCWSRWFRYLFVYTDFEIDELRRRGFINQRISAMNNGLNQKLIDQAAAGWSANELRKWQQEKGLYGRTVLLTVGRLEPKNRFDLMPQLLNKLSNEIPNLLWVALGEGISEQQLHSAVQAAGVQHAVHFAGPEYDEERLAPWFLSADVLVHPGSIGLTLMHAFGYGLPVVTSNNPALHCPEFGIFKDGLSGASFPPEDVPAMAEAVRKVLGLNSPELLTMQQYMLGTVRNRYNVDVMAERFCEIALDAAKSSS